MTTWNRRPLLAVAGACGAAAILFLPACTSQATVETGPSQIQAAGATVMDVRTPEEFAAGHLEGAQNLDISSPQFAAALATLPKDGRYVVYCRSGNRSADAVEEMTAAGFTNVVDAGGLQEAATSTGLPVVTT